MRVGLGSPHEPAAVINGRVDTETRKSIKCGYKVSQYWTLFFILFFFKKDPSIHFLLFLLVLKPPPAVLEGTWGDALDMLIVYHSATRRQTNICAWTHNKLKVSNPYLSVLVNQFHNISHQERKREKQCIYQV